MGDKDASHKAEELKGRAKEAAGSAAGDKDLKREGKADQASSDVKDKVGDAVDTVKDKVSRDR